MHYCKRLANLASQVTDGVIVEIGSFTGKSACALSKTAKVPVYCIDLWDLTYSDDPRLRPGYVAATKQRAPDNYLTFLENTRDRNLISIKGISTEIAKAWNREIGLLFIDGDHSYEGCISDYKGFASYIIQGGILAIHDYDVRHPGVVKAVKEIRRTGLWTDWEVITVTISARRK